MEKRLIVAIVLSFLVLMGYQYFFVKPNKPPVNQPAQTAATPATPVPGTAGAMQEKPQAPPAQAQQAPAQAQALPPQDMKAVAGGAEKDIVVDTPLYRAVWSNKGGVLKSWTLKKYLDRSQSNGTRRIVDKIIGKKAPREAPKPLDLVPAKAAEIGRYPFSIGLDDSALASQVNSALFETSQQDLELADGAKGEIRFVYSDGASVRVEKTLGFTGGSYVLRTDLKVWK